MKKNFDPSSIEKKIYAFWELNGFFKPLNNSNQSNFCIVIPPPNVTGTLHIGHAFQQTIMDISIRYHRMQGDNTFWQVGTDHAGIATQTLVERKIFGKENKTIQDCGKENFIKKIWEWKNLSQDVITNQMRRLGISVDWTKERFTLDSDMTHSVQEAFIILYEKKLIYRRKKLVNWDVKLKTVISDLEVENRSISGNIWYIKYFLVNSKKSINKNEYLIIATTRPETLFGDTAIAVNPNDCRYKQFIGKQVIVPIINRVIPIIGDTFVDQKKGTGCVKITPAHDFNDYEVAIRNSLPMINIFTGDGKISSTITEYDSCGRISHYYHEKIPKKFHNLDRFLVRKGVINELLKLKLLDKVKNHSSMVPFGDRSGSIIEPLLTDQWYLNISPLVKEAIQLVNNDEIDFIPKKYKKIYLSWMENITDWCISRQLLWGHRIPIWYDNNLNIYVGHTEHSIRKKYSLNNNIMLKQEEDVLDTWFSSGLWMFASLGWPKKTDLFRRFYSTNLVVSGFDIIFFWIARMIMLSLYLVKDKNGKGKIPFKQVYITGLICDENGKKMSKSKGNIIDPLDMIDGISLKNLIKKRTKDLTQNHLATDICTQTKKNFPNGINAFGTDALRFTCAILSTPTQYINWNISKLKGYKNFCNKLWNASRFVLITVSKDTHIFCSSIIKKNFSLSDQWIMVELNNTIFSYRNALDSYRFDIAANILYDFIWNKFCDFYIELVKPCISSGSDLEIQSTKYALIFTLKSILCLAHPIIPFITEEIWQKLKLFLDVSKDSSTIMLQPFPKYNKNLNDLTVLEDMMWIRNIFLILRNFRKNMKISNTSYISIRFKNFTTKIFKLINKHKEYIKKIAYLEDTYFFETNSKDVFFQSYIITGAELLIINLGKHSKKLELSYVNKELSILGFKINKLKHKINNTGFLKYAHNDLVKKEILKLNNYKDQKQKLLKKQLILLN